MQYLFHQQTQVPYYLSHIYPPPLSLSLSLFIFFTSRAFFGGLACFIFRRTPSTSRMSEFNYTTSFRFAPNIADTLGAASPYNSTATAETSVCKSIAKWKENVRTNILEPLPGRYIFFRTLLQERVENCWISEIDASSLLRGIFTGISI